MLAHVEAVSAKALEPNELSLSYSDLRSVNLDCDDDFQFVFGDHKVCHVPSIMAKLLSPKVARLRICDVSFDVYTFLDPEMFDLFESLVSSLRSVGSFRVEKSNFSALLRLFQELENGKLLSSLFGMINTEQVTLDEAILLLRTGIDLGAAFSDQSGSLRDFVASHFYEIDSKTLGNLDFETLQLLLSSSSLQIEDEDSLYAFVRSLSENDLKFTSLFEFVYFEYLSPGQIEDFTSFLSENSLGNVNSGIWRQIGCRASLDSIPSTYNPRAVGMQFQFNGSNWTDGIVAYLTRGSSGKEPGTVSVMLAGCGEDDVGNDKDIANCYYSDWKDGWISYDFGSALVIPTSYSVMSSHEKDGKMHLKSWVVQVSSNGYQWTEIDRRDDNNDLNGTWATANFTVARVPNQRIRYFRLKQTGRSHNGNYEMKMSALEIFGRLFLPPRIQRQLEQRVSESSGGRQILRPLFYPELDGVIAYLTRKCGGNVQSKGVVDVTASSVASAVYRASNVVDLLTNSFYSSRNEPNSWICYDFKDLSVIPMKYSLGICGRKQIRNWVIEVSNDGIGGPWVEIDCRKHCRLVPEFNISRIPSESFRFFRLRQTGRNSRSDNCLELGWLEVFGPLCKG